MTNAKKTAPKKAPYPELTPRPKQLHRLVDERGRALTVYDAVSVAQLFASPPATIDAEVARSVYVYPYGVRGAIHRYRVDQALLAAKPGKHKPLASTDAINEHVLNEDSYRPCLTLSSDASELSFLRYGPQMRGAELLALDPVSLALLRAPVPVATSDQLGIYGNPLLPAGPGRVLARVSIDGREGGLHLLDAKTGAVIASTEDGLRAKAWHVDGAKAPYIAIVSEQKLRVLAIGEASIDELATIETDATIEMLDVGPADGPGTFAVYALSCDAEPLRVQRYVVDPAQKRAKRCVADGAFFAEDIAFASHLPQSLCATFDGRLLAVVGGMLAVSGLWEWFGPGMASEEKIVEAEFSDGRVFRVLSGNGAALTEAGQIVPAPRRASA